MPHFPAIHRYTPSENHHSLVARSAAIESVIREIMPIIYTQQRETHDGWSFPRIDFSAEALQYSLQCGQEHAAICVSCWDEKWSKDAWGVAEQLYLRVGDMAPDLDLDWVDVPPPPTPWIYTVWLPPTQEFTRKESARLKKIEAATFFAFMDMSSKK